jgi:hypothetical protein
VNSEGRGGEARCGCPERGSGRHVPKKPHGMEPGFSSCECECVHRGTCSMPDDEGGNRGDHRSPRASRDTRTHHPRADTGCLDERLFPFPWRLSGPAQTGPPSVGSMHAAPRWWRELARVTGRDPSGILRAVRLRTRRVREPDESGSARPISWPLNGTVPGVGIDAMSGSVETGIGCDEQPSRPWLAPGRARGARETFVCRRSGGWVCPAGPGGFCVMVSPSTAARRRRRSG